MVKQFFQKKKNITINSYKCRNHRNITTVGQFGISLLHLFGITGNISVFSLKQLQAWKEQIIFYWSVIMTTVPTHQV